MKNLSQFLMDVPRLSLYVDGVMCNKESHEVLKFVGNKINNLPFFIYVCTQTFLADFYIREFNRNYRIDNNMHLLDDGECCVYVYTDKQKFLITKQFKKMTIDRDVFYFVDFIILYLCIDLTTGSVVCNWSYEIEKNNSIIYTTTVDSSSYH